MFHLTWENTFGNLWWWWQRQLEVKIRCDPFVLCHSSVWKLLMNVIIWIHKSQFSKTFKVINSHAYLGSGGTFTCNLWFLILQLWLWAVIEIQPVSDKQRKNTSLTSKACGHQRRCHMIVKYPSGISTESRAIDWTFELYWPKNLGYTLKSVWNCHGSHVCFHNWQKCGPRGWHFKKRKRRNQ